MLGSIFETIYMRRVAYHCAVSIFFFANQITTVYLPPLSGYQTNECVVTSRGTYNELKLVDPLAFISIVVDNMSHFYTKTSLLICKAKESQLEHSLHQLYLIYFAKLSSY